MFQRLRAAFRMLVGGSAQTTELAPTCRRCAELHQEILYWRGREERTTDALLASKGVLSHVASPPTPSRPSPMASIARGMGISEIDSSKSQQPGQGAMTREPDRAS